MSDQNKRALEEIKQQERELIEATVIFAKYNRAYYEELLSRGFNKAEALELTKAHGLRFLTGESR